MEQDLSRVQGLLDQVKVIVNDWENEKKGFNILHVVGMDYYETMHSALIAELLDPKGSHGMSSVFLTLFLKECGIGEDAIDVGSAKVTTEKSFYVAGVSGRLDIEIASKGKAIIIENKLNAADQDAQIDRYDTYARKTYGKYRILYLTLDGHEPSGQSSKGIKVPCISYRDTIIPWMGECIKAASQRPDVSEPLKQYRNLLREVSRIMSDEKEKSITDILLESGNIKVAEAIGNSVNAAKQRIIEEKIVPRLESLAEGQGLSFSYCNVDNPFYFWPAGWKHLRLGWTFEHSYFRDAFFGLSFNNSDLSLPSDMTEVLKKIMENHEFEKPTDWWPLSKYESPNEYRYWDADLFDRINSDPAKADEVAKHIMDSIMSVYNLLKDYKCTGL